MTSNLLYADHGSTVIYPVCLFIKIDQQNKKERKTREKINLPWKSSFEISTCIVSSINKYTQTIF